MSFEIENKKINEFINKYGNNYENNALDFILSAIKYDTERVEYTDIVRQIYSYLGILPKERDLYYQFVQYINEFYGLDKNIIEVGGGHFPTLAHHISEKQQKLKNGSITVYDTRLITENLDNIKLYKQKFTLNTDISNYDLIIGMMPCDATELIIRSAGIYNKEFVIAMCGCVHLNYPDYSYYDFFKYIEAVAYDAVGREQDITIDYFSEECNNQYPIIRSKRKVLK